VGLASCQVVGLGKVVEIAWGSGGLAPEKNFVANCEMLENVPMLIRFCNSFDKQHVLF